MEGGGKKEGGGGGCCGAGLQYYYPAAHLELVQEVQKTVLWYIELFEVLSHHDQISFWFGLFTGRAMPPPEQAAECALRSQSEAYADTHKVYLYGTVRAIIDAVDI